MSKKILIIILISILLLGVCIYSYYQLNNVKIKYDSNYYFSKFPVPPPTPLYYAYIDNKEVIFQGGGNIDGKRIIELLDTVDYKVLKTELEHELSWISDSMLQSERENDTLKWEKQLEVYLKLYNIWTYINEDSSNINKKYEEYLEYIKEYTDTIVKYNKTDN